MQIIIRIYRKTGKYLHILDVNIPRGFWHILIIICIIYIDLFTGADFLYDSRSTICKPTATSCYINGSDRLHLHHHMRLPQAIRNRPILSSGHLVATFFRAL